MKYFKAFFRQWAARRSPPASQVILNHSTIYILPSKQGLVFFLLIALIWVLGTNYQNNLILGFAFLLLSIMWVSAIHAFKNLLGLSFSCGSEKTAYAGEAAPFEILINSRYSSQHTSLYIDCDYQEVVSVQVESRKTSTIVLHVFNTKRGRVYLPRLTIKTYFPFGLMRAWAYVSLNQSALIFPREIESQEPPLATGEESDGGQLLSKQGEEYYGFKNFEAGVPLSQIAWKQFARGAGLLTKDYRDYQSKSFYLDFSALRSADLEYKLSVLCYWVNRYSALQQNFGLSLPGQAIPLGEGDAHKTSALKALALYQIETDDDSKKIKGVKKETDNKSPSARNKKSAVAMGISQ